MTHPIKTESFSFLSEEGLTEAQVSEMRKKYGRNEFTPPKHAPWWRELLEKFADPTIQILLAAAFISLGITAVEKFLLHSPDAKFIETIGIFLAVLLATLVGYFSERKSAREFELLNKVKDDITIKVLRDGQITTVQIGEIVVGDVVRVDPGDKVPADGVLLDSLMLSVDESMMTGESLPAKKKDYSEAEAVSLEAVLESVLPGNGSFMARGTMVADGHGTFLVTAVGDKTQMGKIAKSLTEDAKDQNQTPLTAKLSRLAKQISVVGVVAAMSIFSVMAVKAAYESPLFPRLLADTQTFAGIVGGAAVLGFLLMRVALKPFFASMDMEMKSFGVRILAAIPMILVSFSVLLAVWGMFQEGSVTGENVPPATEISTSEPYFTTERLMVDPEDVDLLKRILLAFVVAVTIIVVAVPEGLPMMVTVSLALNMMKMARENCLVRKLVASETIGSATVICTDKTGTLTQNRMKPVWIFTGGKEYSAETLDMLPVSPEWEEIVHGIAVNSDADLHVEHADDPAKKTVTGVGNPTECSLLKFLESRGVDYREYREAYPRIFEVGHNSQRKMSLVVVERDGKRHCFMKGAPERVLAECSGIMIGGEIKPLAEYQEKLDAAISEASRHALRVLAFSVKHDSPPPEGCPEGGVVRGGFEYADHPGCCAATPPEEGNLEACLECKNRVFVGLIGIADPVRPEVPAAVRTCLEAGVQVKMITGDALPTAVAIARQANIYHDSPEELVLTSEDFNAISDAELPEKAEHIKVLARSTPMDKLRLVKALHHEGEVIAMTGDGTNDAPALKFADVGLSMGVTGTEVAKEASDIVLVDDNFKSIVTGIWWGRTLFQNIQRFLQFQLSVNVVALLCALIGPLVGVPLPLTVTQLLWINIIMDTFAALALSTDPPRPHTMKEKPIPRDAHIITPTMGISILVVSFYQVAILFAALFQGWFLAENMKYDFSISPTGGEYLARNLEALTVFFTILVMFQFWHKINCRALRHDESPFTLLMKNRMFIGIIAVITVVQIMMVQTPWIGKIFRTTPLATEQWMWISLLTVTIIPVAWLGRKMAFWMTRSRENR